MPHREKVAGLYFTLTLAKCLPTPVRNYPIQARKLDTLKPTKPVTKIKTLHDL